MIMLQFTVFDLNAFLLVCIATIPMTTAAVATTAQTQAPPTFKCPTAAGNYPIPGNHSFPRPYFLNYKMVPYIGNELI